ncbi:hypothetical protein [Parasitella parasitica]|uniref:Uncharacterized protein n=1 Tax=Parasitella parasitica TaxID=35722 RepID=A0A0B7NL41_9FUNG|nr:hypothetical protein [Parasitella parasitica]
MHTALVQETSHQQTAVKAIIAPMQPLINNKETESSVDPDSQEDDNDLYASDINNSYQGSERLSDVSDDESRAAFISNAPLQNASSSAICGPSEISIGYDDKALAKLMLKKFPKDNEYYTKQVSETNRNAGKDSLFLFVSLFIILSPINYLPDAAVKNLITFINVVFEYARSKSNYRFPNLQFNTINRIKKDIGFDSVCDRIVEYAHKEQPRRVRVVLLNTSADNPAVRKLNCFTACGSHRSCWYCTRKFPSLPSNARKRDFSDFSNESLMQTNIDMLETNKQARRWKAINDPKEQASFTKKFGLRWSDFRALPYYNANRCATTDAMHGLFL